jgi:hypothetical protein
MPKQYILPAIFIFLATAVQAQEPLPAAYNSAATINYVRVYEPTVPIPNAALIPTKPVAEVKQSTSYIDGLGRAIQTVAKQVSPGGKDMVSYKVYDAYGRESLQYLGYPSTSSNGDFKTNPFLEQESFYTNQYAGETYYYGKTVFENSPLNRPLKTMAAGNSWVGSDRGSTQNYYFNTSTDAIRIWTITMAATAMPISSITYPEGRLSKTVTADEHGKQVVEFKDKEGKVILKKVQIDNTPSNAYAGWLCTYYIYDDYNQLRYVLPPKAVELLAANNWNFASTPNTGADLRDELCFYYQYDADGRMIVKKVPGAGEVQMIYDARDRLIMTQDANLRLSSGGAKWMLTKYDALNRPTETGLWVSGLTRDQHAAAVGTNLSYPATTSGYELLTQTGYDDYTTIPSASGLNGTLDNSNINITNFVLYTAPPLYAQTIAITKATSGMPTWTMVKVLDGASTPNYLYTVTLYDDKARPIQTKSTNITGGVDVATMQYDFSGKVLRTHQSHQKVGANP